MADGQRRKTFDQLLREWGEGEETRVLSMNSLVAHNLTVARMLRGLTQEQLGQRLEKVTGRPWSKATISALERSADGVRVREFDADDLVALARALDVPLLFFFLPLHTEYHPKVGYLPKPAAEVPEGTRTLDARELMAAVIGSGDLSATVGAGDATSRVRHAIEELLGWNLDEQLGADVSAEKLAQWRDALDDVATELARIVADRGKAG